MKAVVVSSAARSATAGRLRRLGETLHCWWVLLRARWSSRPAGPEVDRCLQLKKGTRFRLSGGEVEILDDEPGH